MEQPAVASVTLGQALKEHAFKTGVGLIVTSSLLAIGLIVGFYYNTLNRLDNTDSKVTTVVQAQTEMAHKINNIEINAGINNVQQTNLEKRLTSVENKIDVMYELLLKIDKSN